MLYGGVNRRNGNYKLAAAIVISLLLLLGATVYSFQYLFLNQSNDRQSNSLLYAKVLNSSMPLIGVTSFEDEDMAEQTVSIKGELLKLLGIDVYNPLSIMSKEISLFKDINYSGDSKSGSEKTTEYNNVISINPFDLTPGQVSIANPPAPNSQGNTGNSNGNGGNTTPNTNVKVDNPDINKPLDNSKPEVLIYHTHTTESYDPDGNYNDDTAKNVCAVGDVLSNELESKYSISVAHDKTVHNLSFNQSYYRSRETVEKYLKKYGDFKLIIDLHRDAVYSKSSVTMNMNGENVSKMMFVLTKKNPHFDKNAAVVSELQKISDKLFPGFCRGLHYYNYGSKYFNQDESNNAILIEVGSNINTLDESKASGRYIARIIAEYLNKKK